MILEEDDFSDVANGVRHRVTYRDEKLYVNIFPMKCELFFSSVLENNKGGILLGAELNMISRMISLAWKFNTVDVVIEQLKRSSIVEWDLPGTLARLLAEEF